MSCLFITHIFPYFGWVSVIVFKLPFEANWCHLFTHIPYGYSIVIVTCYDCKTFWRKYVTVLNHNHDKMETA